MKTMYLLFRASYPETKGNNWLKQKHRITAALIRAKEDFDFSHHLLHSLNGRDTPSDLLLIFFFSEVWRGTLSFWI